MVKFAKAVGFPSCLVCGLPIRTVDDPEPLCEDCSAVDADPSNTAATTT